MELSSSLSLDVFGKPLLLEKRIYLLDAIAKLGSISKAAKSVPMSYKSAWEAVDAMNNLASEPIVERETGGKNGGGTTITPYGKKLLNTYKILSNEHHRFLKQLSLQSDLEQGTLKTIERFSMQLSARNQLQGSVVKIETSSINATVILKFNEDKKLFVIVTNEAVDMMHIDIGDELTAIFKSNSVKIIPKCKKINTNCWQASVQQIEKGEEKYSVTLNIGGQRSISAVISRVEAEKMELQEGSKVSLLIQSNEIILGK